jgi:hypothetical protein
LYSQAKQPRFQTSTKPPSPREPLEATPTTFTGFSKVYSSAVMSVVVSVVVSANAGVG